MFDSLDAQHPAPTAGLGNLLLLLQLLLQLLQHICTPASSLLLLVMHDMLRGCCTKVDVFLMLKATCKVLLLCWVMIDSMKFIYVACQCQRFSLQAAN